MSPLQDGDSSDSEPDVFDPEADQEWQDVEPDGERIQVVSLFDSQVFSNVTDMVEYCKQNHQFDLVAVQKQFGLDFLGSIKLVNYIRSEVKKGNLKPDVSSREVFNDDAYLQPALEDDALLFCLDELIDPSALESAPDGGDKDKSAESSSANDVAKVTELEDQLSRLSSQFNEYRHTVERTLDERWNGRSKARESGSSSALLETENEGTNSSMPDQDHTYFESYSYNDIHEMMLKDTVRTDAYRDFIYDNKQLFQGKIVLDVGCGTGILSMFCARAGAAKVIAVDNSAIIDKARANIFSNGFEERIVCLHGKIEEVTLPVPKVDVIVSEWMGYCLLYEAMLDSVLWARDRYLSPDGLMVPSHCTLLIAPIQDQDYIAENVEFWNDVYGFDMTAMMDKIYDDVLVRHLPESNLVARPATFLTLPLQTVSAADLTFTTKFSVHLSTDAEAIDGWVIWFDTFFLTNHNAILPEAAKAEEWKSKGIAFTTGPNGRETHWKSGVMLVDRKKHEPKALRKGEMLDGTVAYKRIGKNDRALEIDISWTTGTAAERKQTWFMQ